MIVRAIKFLFKWSKGFIKNKKLSYSLIVNITFLLKLKRKNIIFIHLQEHIGDIVACELVSRYAKNKYPFLASL